jgi:hypothetical protein
MPVGSYPRPARGITFVDWSADGYATTVADTALDALAATGANEVVAIVTGYQSDAHGGRVRSDDPRTPTRQAIGQLILGASVRGLRVVLKPHVDIDDGRWRGQIEPNDPAVWFESYRAFLLPWASFADSMGVAQLVVGTELAGTIEHEAEWRRTIAEVRGRFHRPLVYAASWDEAGKVRFWDALDLVGVNAYFPVARRTDAGRLETLAGWAPWLRRLRLLHEQTGHRVLITEIGYRSVDGAGMAPYSSSPASAIDLGEQADLYWAALEATRDEDWIEGLYWWDWPADGTGGPANIDFTPAGKPAANELTAAWSSR